MPKYEAESNDEKVYVHSAETGACVARLCKISAEFYPRESALDVIYGCSFEEFKWQCRERYDLLISERHRPDWAKKRSTV